MTSRIFFIALLVTATSFSVMAEEIDADKNPVYQNVKAQLPPAPKGFTWKFYLNAAFLKPDNWNERTSSTNIKGTSHVLYAASAEEFNEKKQFETGFSLNIIDGLKKFQNLEANKAALIYIKPMLDSHKKEDVLMLDQRKNGDFDLTFFRYRDAPPGLTPIIVHQFLMANNVTDSLHVFIFESPEASWDENWKKFGTPILSKAIVIPSLPSRK